MEDKQSNIIYLLPLSFIIGVVPLIVFAKQIKLDGVVVDYWSKEIDFFAYYKMIAFLFASAIAIGLFLIYLYRTKKIKQTYYYLAIEVYLICIMLSTYYSAVPEVAIWGFPERYEGALVLVGYLLVLFITINLVDYEKDIKFLFTSLFLSAIIISLVGLTQYFGFDLFTTVFGKKFILPTELYNIIDKININFDSIFATLYNPNYVGSYTGMLLALGTALYILVTDKRTKMVLGILNLLIFSNWFGCLSRAGLVGGVGAISLLCLLVGQKLIDKWKSILILGIGFSLVFIMMNYVGNNRLVQEVFSFQQEAQIVTGKQAETIKDIIIDQDQLTIITNETKLQLKLLENNKFLFTDSSGEKIRYNLTEETGVIKLQDNRYQDYQFKIKPKNILHFTYGAKEVNFKIITSPNKELGIIGFANQVYKTDPVEKWGFAGLERLGSGRGYIWSRSLPLIKDTILTGYGPDTYALYFPQYDNVGKLITFNSTKVIVDKPHNLYLQVAINTGVISLLALVTILGGYFLSSIQLYWTSRLDDFYSKVGAAVFVACFAYAIAGLFNDSVIGVAPVFWVLLGIGISTNLKIKDLEIGESSD
ncbi:O-antigen ligase family protein [Halanaerobaculum tunisiense]